MLGFSLLPHSHSPHLDFITCPTLEASFNFVFGLVSLSHSKPLAGGIVCLSSSVRSWRVTQQPGEKNQIISIITESTPLPSSPPILSLPRGVLHVLQTWPPGDHLCFLCQAELAQRIPLVADNGQTHQLCGRGFCQCWELPELLLPPRTLCPPICSRSEPWPWSSYWNPEKSGGHPLLLSDTGYCACTDVSHCRDASFPRRFHPSAKSLNDPQYNQILKLKLEPLKI